MDNLLIRSENLKALKWLIEEQSLAGKVDLVYIDPPFATKGTFVVSSGRSATISAPRAGRVAYTDLLTGEAFVSFIRERAVLLRELLSPQGSFYLHTDYKIGHYLKVMLDEVFGQDHFRNDITRIKCNPKNFKRIGYGNVKDMILFYTKGDTPIWNEPYEAYEAQSLESLFPKQEPGGRRYTTVPIHAPGETLSSKPFKGQLPPPGRHWRTDVETLEAWDRQGLLEWSATGNPRKKIYADEKPGKRMQDMWTAYKDPFYPTYPTEKSAALLERIVETSSNSESWVLDCFCGSGTTLLAAERLGRRWIGIDQSEVALEAATEKLAQSGGLLSPWSIIEL